METTPQTITELYCSQCKQIGKLTISLDKPSINLSFIIIWQCPFCKKVWRLTVNSPIDLIKLTDSLEFLGLT